ncbi:MAG: chain-length determining protein [Hydrogenophilaceae bacterium]|nr:chain-length determining protein [Hydrogenophilaceae bacterium]
MMNFIKRHRMWQAVIVLILFAAIYWGVIASDRYVSEAHIMVDKTNVFSAQPNDLTALLTANGKDTHDQLLLRDYLLSVDMMRKLDARLKLRDHFSNQGDFLSRLWFEDASVEWFHRYYLSRVSVNFDDYTGILVVRVQAFTPEMANKIARMLIEEGEHFMNELAHRLALTQVGFIEKQLALTGGRFLETRNKLLAYQNVHKIVSPAGTIENVSGVVSRLEGQVAELRARKRTLESYLAPTAPDISQINMQIEGLVQQIEAEKSKLATPGRNSLNLISEEYDRLLLDAKLAEDAYKGALSSLEKVRVETTRTLKKLSILQNPTLPEYPLEPRRIYNIASFIAIILMLAGIVHLMSAIIRDHRD